MAPKEWVIKASAKAFRKQRKVPAFATVATLASLVNTMRYQILATMPYRDDDSPLAKRQRLVSFLQTAALLYESLLLLQRLGKHFRHSATFQLNLAPLLSDKKVTRLRDGPLKRIRNQFAYHLNEGTMALALKWLRGRETYTFAESSGQRKADVYYSLVDEAVFRFAVAADPNRQSYSRRFRSLFSRTKDLAIAVADGSDLLIGEYLVGQGWQLEQT
jgi:hypothetical protein